MLLVLFDMCVGLLFDVVMCVVCDVINVVCVCAVVLVVSVDDVVCDEHVLCVHDMLVCCA